MQLGTAVSNSFANVSRTAAVGACLVSASGSLPLHLMSFMVALAVIDNLLPVGRAGWISSCFMVGILAATVGLPLLGFRRVTNLWAGIAAVAMTVVLLGGTALGPVSLLLGWVVVGLACGLLHFLGSTTAGSYPDRHFVFALRLAVVLLAAALVIAGGGFLGGFGSYSIAATVLAAGIALLCIAGMLSYRPPSPHGGGPGRDVPMPASRFAPWIGLGIIALFFIGQPGFTAYAVHLAVSRGIAGEQLPAVYAAAKAISAITLLMWGTSSRAGSPSLRLGALLALAIVVMATTTELAMFALSLVLWEIAINAQSTRLQAIVLTKSPSHGPLWIPAAVAAGAAVGPAIHGFSLGSGVGDWFVAYSVLSAFLPVVWIGCCTRTRGPLP